MSKSRSKSKHKPRPTASPPPKPVELAGTMGSGSEDRSPDSLPTPPDSSPTPPTSSLAPVAAHNDIDSHSPQNPNPEPEPLTGQQPQPLPLPEQSSATEVSPSQPAPLQQAVAEPAPAQLEAALPAVASDRKNAPQPAKIISAEIPAPRRPPSTRIWSRGESLIVACAVAMLAAAVTRAEPLQSANDRSRWCTVWSLVEMGTYQIDDIDKFQRFQTIDKVRHRKSDSEPWHFYSSKPPLLSTMVAGLYWIERRTIGAGLFSNTHYVTRLLLVFVNLIPMAIALCSLRRSLAIARVSETSRMFLMATAGFGSMLNPYLTTLNNHTPAAVCAIFCLSAMIRIQEAGRDGTRLSRRDFASLGFFAALSACFELPAALFGVLAFLFAVRRNVGRTLAWFVPAALIPLAAFFITNWICTGGLKPFYTFYGTDKYVYTHNGVPSYWSNPKGMDANTESWDVYLFHCVLGHHGILSLTPVLLLTLAGWVHGVRAKWLPNPVDADPTAWRMDLLRPLIRIGLVLTFVTLGFYLTRTENYNYGGNSVALRWMVWLTPFWWMAMVPVLENNKAIAARFRIAVILLGLSIVSVNWSQDRPWKPSWLFETMKNAKLIDYSKPAAK